MNKIEIVGLGALNIDNIYQIERIPRDGETVAGEAQMELPPGDKDTESRWVGAFPGGSAANTIYGLAKLGLKTGFVGVIGDDTDGKVLVKNFQEIGVDTSQISVKRGAKTGSALCLTDKLNSRSIQVTPGANSLLTRDDLDLDYINQAAMIHVSSFADDQQFELSQALMAKLDSSVKVSFSPGALYAARGLQALTPMLARTHVLFLNDSEIKQLTGKDFEAGAQCCLELGCHIIVVTLGQGASYKTVMATSYIRTTEREYAVEPGDQSLIPASDTIGAGDAFATGFLYGLLKGKALEECGRLGDIIARFSITRVGARAGLPTLDELSRRYQQLYQKEL